MQANQNTRIEALFNLLAGADETYANLPISMALEIEKVAQGLPEFGPRKLSRRGIGTEFFESRDFRPDSDDPRKINARLSGRVGRPIIVEKEAEISQHIYLWRDPSPSMEYNGKKQASEIMMLAFAKHLAKNEERIGIIDSKGAFRGGRASQWLSEQMLDTVTVVTGRDFPVVTQKIPLNSTAALFSDFLMDPDELKDGLNHLAGLGLGGYLVMILDPEELDFTFKGHAEFRGMEGEGKAVFKRAESLRNAYLEKMEHHINSIYELGRAKGFKLIIQRTDEPLHIGLLEIYGMHPSSHTKHFNRGRKP